LQLRATQLDANPFDSSLSLTIHDKDRTLITFIHMTNSEFKKIGIALEKFGGSFFRSLAPAFKASPDPLNKEIILNAFKKMNGSEKYLPGGLFFNS